MAKNLNEKTIVEATKEGLTLVDFWADWCGPCKMMDPVLAELEKKYQGKISFAKVNVEENQALAMHYKIMSIPAQILFVNGVAKEKVTGFKSQAAMEQYLDQKLEQY